MKEIEELFAKIERNDITPQMSGLVSNALIDLNLSKQATLKALKVSKR